jgi:hypothetical protein
MAELRRRGRALAVAMSIGVLTVFVGVGPSVASSGGADAPAPTVTGPVTGGKGQPTLLSVPLDVADVGYRVEEYLVAGDASAYEAEGTLGADGEWSVVESSSAPYKTRIVVWKPANGKDFNGTVFVEWLNVTGGFDAPFDWVTAHDRIIREGAAWSRCLGPGDRCRGGNHGGRRAGCATTGWPQGCRP